MLSWKQHILPKRKESERIDQLFEIGLVLITVLSASIFEYLWSKYSFDNTMSDADKLKDLSFSFKELTIPILILILLWLLKELAFGKFALSISFKRVVKEFCWTFLSIFLAAEILSVVFLGFVTNPSQVSDFLLVMMTLAFLFTFATTWNYRKHISSKGESKKPKLLARFGATLAEHCTVFAVSYIAFLIVVWLSALPAP
jgi:hypothetical protein